MTLESGLFSALIRIVVREYRRPKEPLMWTYSFGNSGARPSISGAQQPKRDSWRQAAHTGRP